MRTVSLSFYGVKFWELEAVQEAGSQVFSPLTPNCWFPTNYLGAFVRASNAPQAPLLPSLPFSHHLHFTWFFTQLHPRGRWVPGVRTHGRWV